MQNEVRSILVEDMARPAPAADRLCDAIRGAFPLGEVTSSDEALAARLAGTDPEGLHPLVAAVTAEADLLVSHERRRFPDDRTLARLVAKRKIPAFGIGLAGSPSRRNSAA